MKKSIAIVCLTTSLLAIASRAGAEDLVIPLPNDVKVEKVDTVYKCGADMVKATYYNAGNISLVQLGLKGGTVVAANVISASGAKYQGDAYVWWSKNDEADFYDLTADPEMKPVVCVESK